MSENKQEGRSKTEEKWEMPKAEKPIHPTIKDVKDENKMENKDYFDAQKRSQEARQKLNDFMGKTYELRQGGQYGSYGMRLSEVKVDPVEKAKNWEQKEILMRQVFSQEILDNLISQAEEKGDKKLVQERLDLQEKLINIITNDNPKNFQEFDNSTAHLYEDRAGKRLKSTETFYQHNLGIAERNLAQYVLKTIDQEFNNKISNASGEHKKLLLDQRVKLRTQLNNDGYISETNKGDSQILEQSGLTRKIMEDWDKVVYPDSTGSKSLSPVLY